MTLRKHPKSKFWYAVLKTPTGRWTNRSTKQTNRDAALKVGLKLAEAGELAEQKRLTVAVGRKFINDLLVFKGHKPMPDGSIKGYFLSWIEKKRKECTPGTVRRYICAFKRLTAFLKDRAEWDIVHFEKEVIAEFRDYLAETLSRMSANMSIKVLRAMLQDAFRDDLVPANEAMKVKTLKMQGKRFKRQHFTLEQVRLILAIPSLTLHWRGMILMGLYTGQRIGDIATATWGQLDLAAKLWSFRSRKTSRQMILPLHPALLKHLESVRPKVAAHDDPVFPDANARVQASGDTSQLSKQFHDYLALLGLASKQTHQSTGKGRDSRRSMSFLSFHSFRGTLTSIMKSLGASQGVSMDIVGHDTPSVSDNYTTIDEGTKREWIDKMPDVTI